MGRKKNIKKSRSCQCKVEGCTKKTRAKGLCNRHYQRLYKTGILKGVYLLILNGKKFYIGMTPIAGIKVRIERHKTALVNNNKENAIAEVLEYFDKLCIENPEYSREEIWNNFVEYKTLESAPILITRDKKGFNFNPQDAREGFMVLEKNPEIIKRTKRYWKKVEDYYIKMYQEIDRKNGTDNCLNKQKDTKKETRGKKQC